MEKEIDWKAFYAQSNSRLKPSAIREILKITRQPGIISFAGGVPDPKLFPYKELSDCQESIMANQAAEALQYGLSQGCDQLISQIEILARELGRKCSSENILITNGSQQGLDLVARLFLDEGDSVAVTRPCYLGALQAFAPRNPQFLEVSTDDDGPVLSDLEKALALKPKFFYLVPSFQNPTGQSVSRERAEAILSMCKKAKVPILEDAAYEGLYFEKRPQSLRELETEIYLKNDLPYDQYGSVIYLGTFSKIIAPGYRIGWVEAPEDVCNALIVLKQSSDLHTSPINQLCIAEFLAKYSREYWQGLRRQYTRKRDCMLNLIAENIASQAEYYSRPKGGLFVWIRTKAKIDFDQLLYEAVEKEGIAFVPGAPFYASNPETNCLRVSFATASEEEMLVGIKRLAALIRC